MQNLVSVLGAAVSVAALLTVMVFGGHPAMAQPSYYEVPDVPTDLDVSTYLPWQVVKNLDGSYSLYLVLSINSIEAHSW